MSRWLYCKAKHSLKRAEGLAGALTLLSLQTNTDTFVNRADQDETIHNDPVMSHLIMIYTVCHSVY